MQEKVVPSLRMEGREGNVGSGEEEGGLLLGTQARDCL